MITNWSHGRNIEIIWEQFTLTFHCNDSQIHQISLLKMVYIYKPQYKTQGEKKE